MRVRNMAGRRRARRESMWTLSRARLALPCDPDDCHLDDCRLAARQSWAYKDLGHLQASRRRRRHTQNDWIGARGPRDSIAGADYTRARAPTRDHVFCHLFELAARRNETSSNL